ncbi:MAG TPA: TetR family transcriptional regulator [Caulobacteraceae bacterium]|nr:TetR family transcriptional regulator [Caulobacteraceae bacterium]
MSSARDTSAMTDRILRTADRLFYEQGIRAVGVDLVAAEAGVSKRTLYNHFPSKDALIVAYLQRRARPARITDEPPQTQILRLFERLEAGFAERGFHGCPFVNAVAELGEPTHPARAVAKDFKAERRAWFQTLVERMGVADPRMLATQLALLLDGAISAALVGGDPKVARAARDAASLLLTTAKRRAVRK